MQIELDNMVEEKKSERVSEKPKVIMMISAKKMFVFMFSKIMSVSSAVKKTQMQVCTFLIIRACFDIEFLPESRINFQ